MEKIKAVIFDMDGLMIDSEPLHFKAWEKVLEIYGIHVRKDEFNQRYVGIPDKEGTEDMVTRYNMSISAKELSQTKRKLYTRLLQTQLIPQPGLIDLLINLHKSGYKTAISSGSSLEEIRMVIKGLDISHLIDTYVSAEEVSRGKPAPDSYLEAAKRLEVKPEECLVLEDANPGVKAGKAAGMLVFVIPSNETKGQDFSLADKVLGSLSEVFDLFSP